MPNVNRVVMLPADLYRQTMQYADDNELTWNAAVRALVERGLRQTVEPCGGCHDRGQATRVLPQGHVAGVENSPHTARPSA